MNIRVVGLSFAGLLCAIATVAQTSSSQKMDAGSNKMMKSIDSTFLMNAAQGGMAEVQLGKLASEKAAGADVKAFGQQMVQDHSKANNELKSVAAKQGMTVPTTLMPKDQALMMKLQGESGEQFDQTYVRAMVKDHEEDIKEFQKEVKNGADPQVKDFASRTLPVLESHLEKIKSIQAGMGKK
jgi:putative membrane protein